MLNARAFWITRRSDGFESGFVPPAFTAIAMSFEMRVNALAMRSQRANITCFRVSKMRPMRRLLTHGRERRLAERPGRSAERPQIGLVVAHEHDRQPSILAPARHV